jgi:hypothetical protein
MWGGAAVMRTAVTLVAVAMSPQGSTPAPGRTAPPLQHAVAVPARQLAVKIGIDRASAAADGKVSLLIDISPLARMHVYAPGQTDYLPIEFALDDTFSGAAMPAVFPAPARAFLPAVSQVVRVYDAPFRIAEDITLPAASARGAPAVVGGTLKYQACDDSVCYRPESIKLTWQIPRE